MHTAQDLKQELIKVAHKMGINKLRVASRERLDDAPPSGDLGYVLPSARSAISMAVALDKDAMRAYLGKQDQFTLNRNVQDAYLRLEEASNLLQDILIERGHEATDLFPNFEYRDGQPLLAMVPVLSHKFVGVAAGMGWIGWSGNLMTPEFGSAVILTSIVTSAELEPDPMVENDQCDSCHICASTCPSKFMSKRSADSIRLAGQNHTRSKLNGNIRCIVSCGGGCGVEKPDAKWSTWSPKVLDLPGEKASEEEFREACQQQLNAMPKGEDKEQLNRLINTNVPSITSTEQYNMYVDSMGAMSCGNCLYVCWANMEDRRKNYRLLLKSGRVIATDHGIDVVGHQLAGQS